MEAPDSVLSGLTKSPISRWLPFSLRLLYGTTAITRSKPLSAFATCYGIYWMTSLATNRPSGDFLAIYHPCTEIFSAVIRTIEAISLQPASDFQRKNKEKKDDDRSENGQAKKGLVQTVLDVLEIGFLNIRGIGWYVVSHYKLSPNATHQTIYQELGNQAQRPCQTRRLSSRQIRTGESPLDSLSRALPRCDTRIPANYTTRPLSHNAKHGRSTTVHRLFPRRDDIHDNPIVL